MNSMLNILNGSFGDERLVRSSTNFFRLLPEDILLAILTTWLVSGDDKGLLTILSTLDIACCNKALRQSFLSLVAHPALTWAGRGKYVDMIFAGDRWKIMDMTCYMNWIHTRGVRVKALWFNGDTLAALLPSKQPHTKSHLRSPTPLDRSILPTIEHISFVFQDQADQIQLLLQRCPNVTSVDCRNYEDVASGVLPALSPIKHIIKYLILRNFWIVSLSEMAEFLGEGLEELRIEESTFDLEGLQALTQCKHLRVLHVQRLLLSVADIACLFDCCKHLCDLEIRNAHRSMRSPCSNNVPAVSPIVDIGRTQLRSIALNLPLSRTDDKLTFFLALIENYPALISMNVDRCTFDRSRRMLKVSHDTLHLTLGDCFSRILAACEPIERLDMVLLDIKQLSQQLQRIGACVGPYLKELTLRGAADVEYCWTFADRLFGQCHQLERLTVVGLSMAHGGLHQIASHCAQLQYLHISKQMRFDAVDLDGEVCSLIVNCHHLKELHIDNAEKVTSRVLHAILTNKRKLVVFAWLTIGFHQGDVDAFRQQASEQQLLPVPQLIGAVPKKPFLQSLATGREDCVCF